MKKLLFILFFFALSFTGFAQHQYTSYVTASGTNTYAVTVSVPTITNYSTKRIHLRFANANSGASTLNVTPSGASALGAVAIRAWDGDSWEPLAGGEIATGQDYVVVYNGTYFELYPSISGGGGGSGEFTYSIQTISGTTHTIDAAAIGILNKWFIYTNASGCTVTVDDDVDIGRSVVGQRGPSAGTVTFVDNGTSVLISSSGDFDLEAVNRKASLTKQTSTDWDVTGELGPSSGGSVTDVTGTTNRITSTGGSTPQIDISATFEALLSKVAQRIDQNNAATTSAQLATVISDETGTPGNVVFSSAPTLTNPVVGTQSAGDNSTKAASTAYADAKVAESITNGVTGIAPSEDQVFDALALKQSTTLSQNKFLAGNSSNLATAYDLPYVTPEMYGAVGDGSTNDATALQNAINSGIPIMLGPKNYRITTGLTLPSSTTISGHGETSVISVASNITALAIQGNFVTLKNFKVLGSDGTNTQRGITVEGNSGFTLIRYGILIDGVHLQDLGVGFYGINVIGAASGGSEHQGGAMISNCIVSSCTSWGILLSTRAEYFTLSNNTIEKNAIGIRIIGGNDNIIGGQIVDNTTGLQLGTGANDGHCSIIGTKINHNTTNIDILDLVNGFTFVGCPIYAGNTTIVTSAKVKFLGCDFGGTYTMTLTNNTSLYLEHNMFTTSPTLSLTGTAPVCFGNAGNVHSSFLSNTITGKFTGTTSATLAGINTGTIAGNPSSLSDGDVWLNTSSNTMFARINGANVELGATTPNYIALTGTSTLTGNINVAGSSTIGINKSSQSAKLHIVTTGNSSSTNGFILENSSGAVYATWKDDGRLQMGTNGGTSIGPSSNNSFSTSGGGVSYNASNSGANLLGHTKNFSSNSASGNNINTSLRGTYNPSSGGATSTFTALQVQPTINQTGTGTGTVTGITYDPVLTSILGTHYGIMSTPASAFSGVGLGATLPTATWHVIGTTKLEGDVTLPTAGNGLSIKEGTNATMGTGTLVAGSLTVNTNKVTASSRIFYSVSTAGGTQGFLSYTISAGTSFTITSTSATDTSSINWIIIEPAP